MKPFIMILNISKVKSYFTSTLRTTYILNYYSRINTNPINLCSSMTGDINSTLNGIDYSD